MDNGLAVGTHQMAKTSTRCKGFQTPGREDLCFLIWMPCKTGIHHSQLVSFHHLAFSWSPISWNLSYSIHVDCNQRCHFRYGMSINKLPEMPRFPEVVEILKPWPANPTAHPVELQMLNVLGPLKLSEIGTAVGDGAAEESTAYHLANPEILCVHHPAMKVYEFREKLFSMPLNCTAY